MNDFYLCGKTGENFPRNRTVRMKKTYSCSVVESNGTVPSTKLNWEINRVSHQGAWYVSVMRQMVQ